VNRIFGALLFGALAGLFIFCIYKEGSRNFACKKCGALKLKDDQNKCECGGEFEDCKRMRWVKDI
jgi:hypothetical protein